MIYYVSLPDCIFVKGIIIRFERQSILNPIYNVIKRTAVWTTLIFNPATLKVLCTVIVFCDERNADIN